MIWLSRKVSDISDDLSLRGGEYVGVGTRDGVEPRAFLSHQPCRADALMQGVERLAPDVDGGRHGPGILDQLRQAQRRDDEAGLVEARPPPGFHNGARLS